MDVPKKINIPHILNVVYYILSIVAISVLIGFVIACCKKKDRYTPVNSRLGAPSTFCNCATIQYSGASGNPNMNYYINEDMVGTPIHNFPGTVCMNNYNPVDSTSPIVKAYAEMSGPELAMWGGVV